MHFEQNLERLSPRERHVVDLASAGLTDHAIQSELSISVGTLNTYWGRIRFKLGGLSRVEIATHLTAAKAARQIETLRQENAELIGKLRAVEVREVTGEGGLDEMGFLLHAAPDALMVFDHEGFVRIANPAAEELLGYPPGGLSQIHLRALVPERFHGWHAEQRHEFHNHPERRTMGRDGHTAAIRFDGVEVELVTTMNSCPAPGGDLSICVLRKLV